MSKGLYFDCFSGASGDMILGALLDLGLPLEALRDALGSLAVDCGISAERVLRAGVSATRFHTEAEPASQGSRGPHDHAHSHGGHSHGAHSHAHGDAGNHAHHHHSLKEIAGMIRGSALSPSARDRAIHLFERLAEAEAAIHQMSIDDVHLHEVGALDSIVDIVGAVYGLEWLGADQITASPLNVGSGTVECAHGTFPVPAPATARLLRGVPIYAGAVPKELVTPTGALIVTDYATGYGSMPAMRVDAIGYGAGSRDDKGHPNVLRLFAGEVDAAVQVERIVCLECEIDDMNPQLFGPLMDRLAGAGALDVFYAPVQMKKNRPGTLVTVIASPEQRAAITEVLFSDTTTIGVRYQEMLRDRLDREIVRVETPFGAIRFKVATRDGRVLNASPEFDDCARVAAEQRLPVKEIQAIATKAWLDRRG